MPNAQEYISTTLSRFGIDLSDVEIETMLLDYNLTAQSEYTTETGLICKRAIVEMIPELLAMPDVKEDGYAKTINREGVMKFVSILAGKLGLEDPFAKPDGDNVHNLSSVW